MNTKALLSFSTPGKWNKDLMETLKKAFAECGVEGKKVDTVLGWGNLDQDWFEVKTDIETNWGWCRPTVLPDLVWNWLYNKLKDGELLMMVHYITEDGFAPHG